jgi:photosystem II stability/assembly factor-like uncharacterized protein
MLLCAANAQNNGRMKLADIIAEHEKELKAKKQSSTGLLKTTPDKDEDFESEEYQFDRWLWWAKQNTDKDGYVVSQSQAWDYLKKDINAQKSAYKTTATQADWKLKGVTSNTGLFLNYFGNGQGRVNTIGFHPTDMNTFWIGTSSGGAWKTTDFGNTWKCMTDNLPNVVAVGHIAINPLNPNTIYLCTGDAEGFSVGNTGGAGVGLLKSTDGGTTWKTTGLKYDIVNGVYINKLIFNPMDTNKLVCATNKALYQSNDGGANWFVLYQYPSAANRVLQNVWDAAYAPGDSNALYSVFFVRDTLTQTRYTYFVKRQNGTGSFSGAISTNCSRANLAVSKDNPNVVYAVTAFTTALPQNGGRGAVEKIYYSDNKMGVIYYTYDKAAGAGNGNILGAAMNGSSQDGQGLYDMAIAIDPLNKDHIRVGGINGWESNDNGSSWQLFNQWRDDGSYHTPIVHADKHFMAWHPLDASFFFECNDGGIFYQKNGTWTNITPGLSITQFYRNAVSSDGKFVLGGAQDNGTQFINMAGGSHQVGFGDGEECQVDYANPNLIYWASQFGNLFRYNTTQPIDSTNKHYIRGNIPHVNDGAWTTPYLLDPLNHNRIIAGFDTIFVSNDTGETWTAISTKLGANMNRLAMTPANSGTIYAVEDKQTDSVFYTHNFGGSWSVLEHTFPERTISDIKVDPKDKDRIWVTFSGWNNTNMVAEYTSAGGWKSISKNLPKMPVYCISVDSSDGTLYIGSYDGVYYLPKDSVNWQLYNANMPHVNVYDLDICYTTGEIIAATWGRGMWASPKYLKPIVVGVNKTVPYAFNQLTIYPNPVNDKFTVVSDVNQFHDNEVQVSILDVKGRVVFQHKKTFRGNNLELSELTLPSGVYVLDISKDGVEAQARIVIAK